MIRQVRKAYLRIYDPVAFVAKISLGYVRSKFSGATFGRFPIILGKVRFHIRGEAFFGERMLFLAEAWEVNIDVAEGATLTVGSGTGFGGGSSIEAWHSVTIGNNVMVAPFASILDDDRHEVQPGVSLYRGPTVIGDNVWLGRGVVIQPGVTVGSGSVIGSNAVVTKDIPPNSLAAGSPARVIRELDLPCGWSHRFGYDGDRSPGSLLSRLKRLWTMKPADTLADLERPERIVNELERIEQSANESPAAAERIGNG